MTVGIEKETKINGVFNPKIAEICDGMHVGAIRNNLTQYHCWLAHRALPKESCHESQLETRVLRS